MSNSHPHKRRAQHRGQLILLLILVAAVLYAGLRCFVLRAPEQREDLPAQTVSSENGEDANAAPADEDMQSHAERKADFYTILVSGVDDGNGGSDTNLVVAVETAAATPISW